MELTTTKPTLQKIFKAFYTQKKKLDCNRKRQQRINPFNQAEQEKRKM
jgi:hypothetical protein